MSFVKIFSFLKKLNSFSTTVKVFPRLILIFNSEVELPETLTYKEISCHLIEFIENYLTEEKIYKVLQNNNEIKEMKKELFDKCEEIRKLKENLQHSIEKDQQQKALFASYELLKKESSNFQDKISQIKKQFVNIKEKQDIEPIKLENTNLNIASLELKEVKSRDNFIFLKE